MDKNRKIDPLPGQKEIGILAEKAATATAAAAAPSSSEVSSSA